MTAKECRIADEFAVVGGSSAGLFAAYLLARAGMKVQLFEQAGRLESAPRTLIVTNRMLEFLGGVGRRAVVNQIKHFELFADGRVATVSLGHPDLVIERSALARVLGELAESAGAHVILGRRFLKLCPGRDKLTLLLERVKDGSVEEANAATVVGADGAFSSVARAAGWSSQRTVPLVQAVVRLPRSLPAETARVWFVPDETPYFYWLIPESRDRGVLGLIGECGEHTRRCLERFLDKQGFTAREFQGARIPVYERWVPPSRSVDGGRVYLVGDAAGHVKVSTVGGVVTGLLGALGVVEVALNRGSTPSRRLRLLRRELELHRLIRNALGRFTEADYRYLLGAINAPTRTLLSSYTRDDAGLLVRCLWLKQPRFVFLAARALLRSGLTAIWRG